MRKLLLLTLLLVPISVNAAEGFMGKAHNMKDRRTFLNLSPEMRHHQLTNMRAHLAAIQKITGLIAERKYDKAAQIAHSQLGLTDEVGGMYAQFENEEFKAIGILFHSSGDKLGDALKTRNSRKVLKALGKTLGYCVQCHEKFQY